MISEGERLQNRYLLQALLGKGGMGKVWLARDEMLGRQVALKELNGSAPAERRQRAVREARALAVFSHPSIVGIYDMFFAGDDPWIVMEYIPGRSLADLMEERTAPMSEAEIARIAQPVLGGLRAAHAAGVVHRDVKPSNILVTDDGAVFLVDFGIAKIAGDLTLTASSKVMGTPEFLAPEQVRGTEVSGATDLWSLGVTIFCAMEGYSPFRRADAAATMFAVVAEKLPDMRSRGRLARMVPRLLRKEPARRAGAGELDDVLAAILAGQPDTEAWPPPPRPPRPGPRPPQASPPQPSPPQSSPPQPSPPQSSPARPSPRPPRPRERSADGRRPGPGPKPRRGTVTMTERDAGAAREKVSQAGTAAGAAALCAMTEQNAALVLSGYPGPTTGALIEAIAAAQPQTASAILRMLSAAKAGAAVNSLKPKTAAAILGAMPVRQAVRILDCANARRAGGIIAHLPPGIAVQVVAALPEQAAASILAFVGPPRVAELISAPDGPGHALLARFDEDFRAQVVRHLSR
jgi:eukaryotic-like serine/threonine-protein kinase